MDMCTHGWEHILHPQNRDEGRGGGIGCAPSNAVAKTPLKPNVASANRSGVRQHRTSRALSTHLHLRSHRPSGQTKTKAQAFHFLLLLLSLKKKIKQNPAQPQDSYFYGAHPARLLLHEDVINAIYSSANNRAPRARQARAAQSHYRGDPSKSHSAGRTQAAISGRSGCKIKLN